MFHTWLTLAITSFLFLACSPDEDPNRFPCGNHGGSCDRDSEVCVLADADGCSTCVPLPAACDPKTTCGCLPPGTDAAFGAYKCTDAGTCEEVDGQLVLTCKSANWGCG